ncbi:nucleic acid-binding, OB-fold protein [Artemisia annua]|uniref:Nucleic acid-binding, OB-fold protein n=1 Tax=Artemisia annua TaxID=35608 RepID=A0A2U1Q0H6_ARTAN|nr:nucleic acid-binding, OB-fold protein [Artemisia annua]
MVVTDPDDVEVADIQPTDSNKVLEVKGHAIQANVEVIDMRQFDTNMQVNSCYRIQGFRCKKTENRQQTLENNITLLFGKYTRVTPLQDEGFLDHYFNFVSYNELGPCADARDSILTDYIGIIRTVGNIKEFGDPTTNRILRKNIEIQNLNGNSVTLSLWNEMATRFELQNAMELEQPVIIATCSCSAKRYGGIIQLSATPATSYYLNTKVPEADHIRAVYCFKAIIADVTGSASVTYFSPEADSLLPSCRRKGSPKLILNHAADASTPMLPAIPTEEMTTTSSTNTETPDQKTTVSELSIEKLTPPLVSSEPVEKKQAPKDIGSSSVRKQLFEKPTKEAEAPKAKKPKKYGEPADD